MEVHDKELIAQLSVMNIRSIEKYLKSANELVEKSKHLYGNNKRMNDGMLTTTMKFASEELDSLKRKVMCLDYDTTYNLL